MFRTELTIAPAAGQLPRAARVLTMGSCFADSMGARLAAHKVETRVNPFGTVFQPLALMRLLRAAAGEEVDWQQHLVQARGRWQSYDLHGSIGADSPVELLQYIQEMVRQTGEFLRSTDLVLLTLGTAWAYRLRETGGLVSNCHKQPADLFVRELLTPDEIINALAETHAYLRRINPELRFVLTVSPVRHLKDTLPLNSVSKSVLRVATHIVSDLLPGVAYFPAFELLTDDLRDYRFYAADMLHPSETAEDYIWDKFARTYFDADFGRFRKEWAAVRQALDHRPLHEGAPEHREFLESTREKLEQLSLRQVDVAAELRTVRARLAALPLPAQPASVAEPEDDEERIDIGEGVPISATQPASAVSLTETASSEQPVGREGRPPRLSPEEFRAQRAARPERGRRDGRGKSQAGQPTETEQFQTASFAEADEPAQQPFPAELPAVDLVPTTSALEAIVSDSDATADEDASEGGRKKKRRSRGGAKRTARKHALRLVAEMDPDESQLPASEAALEAAAIKRLDGAVAPALPPQNQTASPEARDSHRNRRNEGGRDVARAPLFAAAPAADPLADPSGEVPESAEAAADPTQTGALSSSRKSRNRKKKKGGRPTIAENENADASQGSTPTQTLRGAVEAVVDQEKLNAARNNSRRDNRRPQDLPVAALPVDSTAPAAVATPVVLVAAPANAQDAESSRFTASAVPQAAKPSKRKSRAMVGGRTEKPAFDTAIIPIADASVIRTEVAAGRLMGASASLVEPTRTTKVAKATVPAKPAAPKTKGTKTSAPTAPGAAEKLTASARPKSPGTSAATPAVSTDPKPLGTGLKQTKPAKADGTKIAKTSVAPKAAATTSASAAIAPKPAKKSVPTTLAIAKAAPSAAPQPTAIGNELTGAKPTKKAPAIAKSASAGAAKPASKPMKLPAAAPVPKSAPASKALAEAAKPAAAQKKAPPKTTSTPAAPPPPAKPAVDKTKTPKKRAS